MSLVKRNIIWLASYPKSGNTWFRAFLSSLLSEPGTTLNINSLLINSIASSRNVFDQYLGINSSDLRNDEIDILKPELFKMISADCENKCFIKTHDIWELNENNNPIFPKEITKGVIYFIRNPLDVVVSLAFHNNVSISEAIKQLNDIEFTFCGKKEKLYNQLPQRINSWSRHVDSWCNKSDLPIHIIRYEDMIQNTEKSFMDALGFLELTFSKTHILASLNKCSFDNLQQQELEFGFVEKNINSKLFFRSGTIDNWKYHLSSHQAKMIINQNEHVMTKFGYLP